MTTSPIVRPTGTLRDPDPLPVVAASVAPIVLEHAGRDGCVS